MGTLPDIQLYLQLPTTTDPADLYAVLQNILPDFPIAACLFPVKQDQQSWEKWHKDYTDLCQFLQKYDCATLVQDLPDLTANQFSKLGFDGINLAPDVRRLKYWHQEIGTDYILGCDVCDTRHNAMLVGEQLADYIMLPGDDPTLNLDKIADPNHPNDPGLLQWWTMMMQTPVVAVSQKIDIPDFLYQLEQIRQQKSDFILLTSPLLSNIICDLKQLRSFLTKIYNIVQ